MQKDTRQAFLLFFKWLHLNLPPAAPGGWEAPGEDWEKNFTQ